MNEIAKRYSVKSYFLTQKSRIVWELIANCKMIFDDVYILKNLDEYALQLKSLKEKDDVYWKAGYFERLIDFIKISIAFENYNKAILIEKNYVVHLLLNGMGNNQLVKSQRKGQPILFSEINRTPKKEAAFDASAYCIQKYINMNLTISYKHTLNTAYQEIIDLPGELLRKLNDISVNRNKLHFYLNYPGAFEVSSHIENLRELKAKGRELLENELKRVNEVYKKDLFA